MLYQIKYIIIWNYNRHSSLPDNDSERRNKHNDGHSGRAAERGEQPQHGEGAGG